MTVVFPHLQQTIPYLKYPILVGNNRPYNAAIDINKAILQGKVLFVEGEETSLSSLSLTVLNFNKHYLSLTSYTVGCVQSVKPMGDAADATPIN